MPGEPDEVADDDQPTATWTRASRAPGGHALPRQKRAGAAKSSGSKQEAKDRAGLDTMAADLAGWTAGELPGQASHRCPPGQTCWQDPTFARLTLRRLLRAGIGRRCWSQGSATLSVSSAPGGNLPGGRREFHAPKEPSSDVGRVLRQRTDLVDAGGPAGSSGSGRAEGPGWLDALDPPDRAAGTALPVPPSRTSWPAWRWPPCSAAPAPLSPRPTRARLPRPRAWPPPRLRPQGSPGP